MSKPLKHDNDMMAAVDRQSRSRKRWPQGHSLCNQPPQAPTGVSITWDRIDQTRHAPTRGIVNWDEVTVDVDGFTMNPKDIGHYVINFQKSEDGSAADAHTRKFVVEAKDGDADTTGEKVIRAGIHKKRWYRARVRAVDKEGRRGPWSSYTSWQHPNPANNAAAPENAAKIEAAQRVGIKWDPPGAFSTSDNVPDLSVSHYQVQINTSTGFGSGTMKRDAKHVVNDQYRYVVPNADDGVTHYLRVRSVSADGDVSSWQPADTGVAANNTAVGGVAGFLPGTIIHHATAVPNTWAAAHGYLYCNGQSVATATYVDLFAEIGYTYGGSGGSFNVPDSKGRHIIGPSVAIAVGANDGDAEGSRSPGHQHDTDSTDATPASDGTGHTPDSDSSAEGGGSGHNHGATNLFNSGPDASTLVPASPNAQSVAGPSHGHNIGGTTGAGTHGHGHNHNSHGHNHGHGNHPHPHPHNQKNRPHIAMHLFIKT